MNNKPTHFPTEVKLTQLSNIHLVLFLSRATPLHRWDTAGIIAREIAFYKEMRPYLKDISIVTSGGKEELHYQNRLGNINILYNRWKLPPNLYSLLSPFLHRQTLKTGSIFKTNQLDGAWTAIIAGWLYHKPVIVRAGYLWAEDFDTQYTYGIKRKLIHHLQKFAFRHAQSIILTTKAMENRLVQSYKIPSAKITVIPNYVDTNLFRPMPEIQPEKGRICYVGRLHPIKNLEALITAIAAFPNASLLLVGKGTQKNTLEKLAADNGVKAKFVGLLPNDALPKEINQAEIFILPSLSEGHPKALIEAMACGAAVIGTNVRGIQNVIKHEETGLLCPPTVAGIQAAVQRLLNDDNLRAKLGQAAYTFAVKEYELANIVHSELALYDKVQQS